MANDNDKYWSEQHGQYIDKDRDGNGMIDEFGPTDEFILARELKKKQSKLKDERSYLHPKGPLPFEEEGRYRADTNNDKDALKAALIDEQIDNLEWMKQEELEQELDRLEKSKIGKVGAAESKKVRQESKKKRHEAWKELATKKKNRNHALKPWTIAKMISNAYVEQGRADPYNQRTVFEVIKNLDCFRMKKN